MVTTVDQRRLMVATHEMGHAIAWHRAGFRIESIAVRGHGRSTTGCVQLQEGANRTPDEARDYLIGLLAGREADHKWCAITGQTPDTHGSSVDLHVYRKYREHDRRNERWTTHLSDRDLRIAARNVITAEWARIVESAERLAHCGRIRL